MLPCFKLQNDAAAGRVRSYPIGMTASSAGEASTCPACGGALSETTHGVVQCQACDWRTIAVIDDEAPGPDEIEFETSDTAAALDNARIRKIVTLRRADNRARTYCIVAAAGCAVGSVQLTLNAAGHGLSRWGIGEITLAALTAAAAFYLAMQARIRTSDGASPKRFPASRAGEEAEEQRAHPEN